MVDWEKACRGHLILTPNGGAAELSRRVRAGEEYTRVTLGVTEPEVATSVKILYRDDTIVVVDKPAPLPVHPCGRYNHNTLAGFFQQAPGFDGLRPCHRLDANTTGVMVWAHGKEAARAIHLQFVDGKVQKTYVARVHGWVEPDSLEVEFPLERLRGAGGLRNVSTSDGILCRTFLSVAARHPDGTTTLEIVPRSGRTNQIRVHLWHLGHPIVGDPSYLPDGRRNSKLTLDAADPAMKLHCRELRLVHPASGKELGFSAAIPWE